MPLLHIKAPSFRGPADRGVDSVRWNGNVIADALDLDLGLSLDLICRVIRHPTAVEPRVVSLLPREGEGPAEDPRAGPKLALLLHTKAPSF